MARYLEIAGQANDVAKDLILLIPEDDRPRAAEMIARLVNLAFRSSPRPAQSTVRLNAVKRAVQGLPVRVGMVEKTDDRTKRTYNALTTTQLSSRGDAVLPESVEGPLEE